MGKKAKRAKKSSTPVQRDPVVHTKRRDRPHVAQEFQENGQHALAEEATLGLLPEFARRARGLA